MAATCPSSSHGKPRAHLDQPCPTMNRTATKTEAPRPPGSTAGVIRANHLRFGSPAPTWVNLIERGPSTNIERKPRAHLGQPELVVPGADGLTEAPRPPGSTGNGVEIFVHSPGSPAPTWVNPYMGDKQYFVGPTVTGRGRPGGEDFCGDRPHWARLVNVLPPHRVASPRQPGQAHAAAR